MFSSFTMRYRSYSSSYRSLTAFTSFSREMASASVRPRISLNVWRSYRDLGDIPVSFPVPFRVLMLSLDRKTRFPSVSVPPNRMLTVCCMVELSKPVSSFLPKPVSRKMTMPDSSATARTMAVKMRAIFRLRILFSLSVVRNFKGLLSPGLLIRRTPPRYIGWRCTVMYHTKLKSN